MLNSFRKLSSQNLGGLIRSFIFFILFYLYLWLSVELHLIYHGSGMIEDFPVFFQGWVFFQELISHPGGPVEYLSAFLSQFLYYSWAGALVVTLQAWLICVCTGAFIKATNNPHLRCVRFIPPMLLLIIYTQYTYHFVTTTALLAALLFVCLYIRITSKGKLPHLVAFLVMSVILYYIAGGAYLLFAVLCAIYELLFRRRWRMGLLYLLSALLIPYVEGVLVFGVSIINAFSDLLPLSWKIHLIAPQKTLITVYILYLFLPLTALGLGLWQLLFSSTAPAPYQPSAFKANPELIRGKKKTKKKPRSKSPKPGPGILSWYFRSNKLRWVLESVFLFVIAGATIFFSYNNELKTEFEVDYYAYHKKWPQVLKAARHNPYNNYFIAHAVNRALYHTGRLGYDMLSYPQHPDTLFLTFENCPFAYWKRFDTYIDLGHMNLAERNLVESLERFKERPRILKRLALINMVKANSGAARVYLGALSKTLFHADWANNYLARLQSDPNLSEDQEIQHLRCLMIEKDYDSTSFGIEDTLLALLERNRQNQMTFEYLMAYYLLTNQIEKTISNIGRMADFSYTQIPWHYEEAILVYQYKNRMARKVDLKGRRISLESYQRLGGFSQVFKRYGRNKQAALNDLEKDYGDSYFFYNIYGFSGVRK